jgi:hypothetical protein
MMTKLILAIGLVLILACPAEAGLTMKVFKVTTFPLVIVGKVLGSITGAVCDTVDEIAWTISIGDMYNHEHNN